MLKIQNGKALAHFLECQLVGLYDAFKMQAISLLAVGRLQVELLL
jgi:hypothetical protein